MATPMDDDRRRAFLSAGTRTAVLSTVRKDGTPHAALTVDEAAPPFTFVTPAGPVEMIDDLDELLVWATRLGGRYMGAQNAGAFVRRNAVPEGLLVRLTPDRVVALAGVAD